MSRALGISQQQVSHICKAAEKEGFVALVQIGDEWKRLNEVSPPCFVYVLRCEGYVKIGKTTKQADRLAALRTANPFDLELIASLDSVDGGDILERDLHKRFAKYRHKGEWFRIAGWLEKWIDRGCPI